MNQHSIEVVDLDCFEFVQPVCSNEREEIVVSSDSDTETDCDVQPVEDEEDVDLRGRRERESLGTDWSDCRRPWERQAHPSLSEWNKEVNEIRKRLKAFKARGYRLSKQRRMAIKLLQQTKQAAGLCQSLSISVIYDSRQMKFIPTVAYKGHQIFKASGTTIVDFLTGNHWRSDDSLSENISRYCSFLRGWIINSARANNLRTDHIGSP
eukprot:GILJ01012610.1.p1 GENE.GILJ01012610.1~~GILJ01012610.1.p1  ORF type:complete len:209 (-),score=8.94 GILJ01012610.1:69-695(-)